MFKSVFGYLVKNQRLQFDGKTLNDFKSIENQNLQDGSEIEVFDKTENIKYITNERDRI